MQNWGQKKQVLGTIRKEDYSEEATQYKLQAIEQGCRYWCRPV